MAIVFDGAIIRLGSFEGVSLSELSPGDLVEVRTDSRTYRFLYGGDGRGLISGHPKLCPRPVEVEIIGSCFGTCIVREGFIGRGMCLEFRHPTHGVVTTSQIHDIRIDRADSAPKNNAPKTTIQKPAQPPKRSERP